MSPTKRAASPSAVSAGPAKDRKVSAKKQDAAMAAMESELIQARVSTMIEAVNEEMSACEQSATQCYAVCVENKKNEKPNSSSTERF